MCMAEQRVLVVTGLIARWERIPRMQTHPLPLLSSALERMVCETSACVVEHTHT